jgi:hypothetical protein
MRPRLAVIISITAIISIAMASPVDALSFDFHYFETDQMTYEVGETIGMVARMIADYDEGGWCYVSFAVVTDKGPVYDDAYFIPASPDIRYFTSSYTIVPENTSPFPDPVTAYVIFNVEIFDKYSQGASETIEVNITRGRIEARAITPLTVETNENTSIGISLASRYNENVSYSSQPVIVEIYNSTSDLVFTNATNTDSLGIINLEWNPIPYSPDVYTIQVSGNGTSAFLPFTELLSMTVEPELSSFNISSVSNDIYCQTPSGNSFENVEILLDHIDKNLNPITGAQVKWETSFATGNMTSQGLGRYFASIPFTVEPGLYDINVTALHPLYQNATEQLLINVLSRNISAVVINEQELYSNSIKTTVTLSDWQSGELLANLPLTINISLNSWSYQISSFTNSTGSLTSTIDIPLSEWGYGDITLSLNTTQYYGAFELKQLVEIQYIPQVFSNILIPAARGEISVVQIEIQDPLGFPTTSITIELLNVMHEIIGSGLTDSYGIVLINWSVPSDSVLGLYDYTIRITTNTQHTQAINTTLPITIYHPLWVTPSITSWNLIRGTSTIVEIYLESEGGIVYPIPILFNDSLGEFSKSISLIPGAFTNITFDVGFNITPGRRSLQIFSLNTSFALLEFAYIEVTILTQITSQISNISAFYEEAIEFNLTTLDDELNELDKVGINIYLQGNMTPIATVDNSSTSARQSITLPNWISPGSHQIVIEIYGTWSIHEFKQISVIVWVRTKIDLSITIQFGGQMMPANQSIIDPLHHLDNTMEDISSGSISLPPPILFNDTTSVELSTDFDTSPDNCPRLNSGTNNLSTVSENSFNSFIGKGHSVLSLNDLKEELLSIIASSTDLEVLPKETTPHSASDGPEMTTSTICCKFFTIFFSRR